MATNFLAARNSNLSSFNVISINYSTIRGSTIASVSTMNVSTIVNSNITAVGINYSTLVGSSIVTNAVITQSLGYSTLTGSSITGSALTVGNIQGTSVSASTITTTGNVGIGTNNPTGNVSIYGSNYPSIIIQDSVNTSEYITMFRDHISNISLIRATGRIDIETPANYRRMTILGNGNVGIGITNPSSLLQVNGTTTFGNVNATSNSNTNAGTITAPASSGQAYGSTATNYYGTKLHIYGGNLSVSVWDNSNYGGDIVLAAGDVISYENNGTVGGSYVGGNAVIRSGRVAVNNVAGNTQTVIPGSIFFQIGSGSRNSSSSLGDYNTAMTITSSGNVGIGTTNPSNLLHLYASNPTLLLQTSVTGYNSGNCNILFTTATASYPLAQIKAIDMGVSPNVYRGDLVFYSQFNTTLNEAMRIQNGGNVGIGTNNPSAPLHVLGSSNGNALSGQLFISDANNTAQQGRFFSYWSGAANASSFLSIQSINTTAPTYTSLLLNPLGGYVGIGTNNPSSPLHIYANTSNILTLDSSLGPTYMSFSANGAARALIGIDNSAGEGLFGSGVAYGLGIGTVGNTPTIFVTNNAIRMTIASNGNVSISGSLSKGSGTFDIEHPLYPNTNRRLVHSFIEGPRCDLIYRGIIVLTNGSASVYIDKQCTYTPENAMDDGTFEALCVNPQYFLQNMSGFNRVIGSIYRGILTITCENNTATDTISWMVVAERKDPFVKNWDRTDSNGYLNTQYIK